MTPTLTTPQRAALKTAIQADATANTLYVDGNLDGLAAHLNDNAAPVFTVWKTLVSLGDVGKTFNATDLAGLTQLNTSRLQNIAAWLAAGVNPSLASIRQFFDDIFSGAGGAATRTALLVLWKRPASRVERVFATGTGSDASPGFIVSEGPISTGELVGL